MVHKVTFGSVVYMYMYDDLKLCNSPYEKVSVMQVYSAHTEFVWQIIFLECILSDCIPWETVPEKFKMMAHRQ